MYRIASFKNEKLSVAYEADVAAVLSRVAECCKPLDASRLLAAIATMSEGDNVACGFGLVRVTRLAAE